MVCPHSDCIINEPLSFNSSCDSCICETSFMIIRCDWCPADIFSPTDGPRKLCISANQILYKESVSFRWTQAPISR